MISNLSSHLFQDMDYNNYEAMKTAVIAVVTDDFRCSGRRGQPHPGL
ncbi:Uncharacterised protein [Cardiobacterium valvarum]|uniref:Uncharacterized protein n=1 Tax=Cardiobacterium valvarum TaxID=194702 RepID=A0A381E545_9GAMM|nr:Uncharacterised protein [Cardiobacterium valvarum]